MASSTTIHPLGGFRKWGSGRGDESRVTIKSQGLVASSTTIHPLGGFQKWGSGRGDESRVTIKS
ncbi:MAG: hypothetical protein KDB01_14480, partial [Planctomycetaceae bacterium]|nr:hypothetical protein [Planctomycetaceae bacterium]